MSKRTQRPEAPQPRVKAVVRAPGKRVPLDLAMIPALVGETTRIQLRCDVAGIDAINRHLDRLQQRAPGLAISVSDAVRSLIREGDISFQQQDNDDD